MSHDRCFMCVEWSGDYYRILDYNHKTNRFITQRPGKHLRYEIPYFPDLLIVPITEEEFYGERLQERI